MSAPKPVTLAARFIQWGAASTREGPCLTLSVVPDTKDKTPMTVSIPLTKKDNGAVEPPDDVKSLAGRLRIGDEIQLTYVKSGTSLKYRAAAAKGADDPKRDEATLFTFSARRTLSLRGNQVQAVLVTRGPMTWTFLVPDADPKDKAYQPDPELLKKVQECRRGNTVRLTYDPAEYMFWIRDIEIVEPPDEKKDRADASGDDKKDQGNRAETPTAEP